MSLILTGVLVLFILYLLARRSTKKRICNTVDGRCYKVSTKYNNKDDASVMLANINIYCVNVLRHMRNKFILDEATTDPYILKWRTTVAYLIANYDPDNIIENTPSGIVNTSYVEDKGRIFAICLREKMSGNDNFQNMHDLHFVVLHELSHMATYGYGHDLDFWTNFKFMLTEANIAGLHAPVDYSKTPINYCKLQVDYNPYFDQKIKL
jgi:hypothetical protein